MAEDPKIIPSPPPAEPFDVPVTLDPPPARPFDVPITRSGPPAEPFDVPVSPDGPPWGPTDVATSPSPPPTAPHDVATRPSPGPGTPFDVAVSPSGPPATPIDVAITPDLGPAPPHDVTTTPSPGPGAPIQVTVAPDPPPAGPVDVGITPSPPPGEPFDVRVIPSPSPLDIPGIRIDGTPTIQWLLDHVGKFNGHLGSFLSGLLGFNPINISVQGGGALDPRELARWFSSYVQAVGNGGLQKFIGEQQALYAMNPEVAQVFDPTYFIKMMVPGSMGHVHTTIDTQLGRTSERVAQARDAILAARVSADPVRPGGDDDAFGPSHPFSDGADFSVDQLTDAALDGLQAPYTKKSDDGTLRFDASKYFEERSAGGMRTKPSVQAGALLGEKFSTGLRGSAAIDGVIRSRVRGENDDGSVLSPSQDPSEVVDDDDTRLPISFTDLRKDPVSNRYRSVYFRPLNLTISKSVTPNWNEAQSFGRVDASVGYVATSKTFSISFDVHAMAPEDLENIHQKMVILESMCYPSYGSDSLMKSGPVVRLRVGDLVANDLGGMPGIIKGLNIDYGDALWELRKGMKVPRSFKVSIDYLVLHDGPVGLLDGKFGVLRFPAGSEIGADTNLAASNESQDNPEIAQVLPNRYARFGEPRRK